MERPFDQPENCASFTDRLVTEQGYPVLLVTHDEDDHARQFLSGIPVGLEDSLLVGLKCAVDRDPTLYDIADLEPGYVAVRSEIGGERSIYPHDEYFAESEDNNE